MMAEKRAPAAAPGGPAGADLDRLVSPRPTAPGSAPTDLHEAAFREPWELRAVGVVAGLVERGMFTWPQFQRALIDAIARWERDSAADGTPWSYYACWQAALEHLVLSGGAVGGGELGERTDEFLSGRRTPPHTHGGGLLATFPPEGTTEVGG